MTDYSVERWVSKVGPLVTVMEELETKLETYASAKTIRAIGIIPVGNNSQAYLLIDE